MWLIAVVRTGSLGGPWYFNTVIHRSPEEWVLDEHRRRKREAEAGRQSKYENTLLWAKRVEPQWASKLHEHLL